MFQQQPGTWMEVLGGVRNDLANIVQTIHPADQGLARLCIQGRQMRVALCNIGWVGDDQVKLTLQLRKPVAVHKIHCQRQGLGIATRQDLGVSAGVYGGHMPLGAGMLQGQSDSAAAGTKV